MPLTHAVASWWRRPSAHRAQPHRWTCCLHNHRLRRHCCKLTTRSTNRTICVSHAGARRPRCIRRRMRLAAAALQTGTCLHFQSTRISCASSLRPLPAIDHSKNHEPPNASSTRSASSASELTLPTIPYSPCKSSQLLPSASSIPYLSTHTLLNPTFFAGPWS